MKMPPVFRKVFSVNRAPAVGPERRGPNGPTGYLARRGGVAQGIARAGGVLRADLDGVGGAAVLLIVADAAGYFAADAFDALAAVDQFVTFFAAHGGRSFPLLPA